MVRAQSFTWKRAARELTGVYEHLGLLRAPAAAAPVPARTRS
jgi:hypothetical protein